MSPHDSRSVKGSKSQSALEYMMTYGWAILIIVIVAAGLYSLGIFSPTNSASTSITGFSNFGVQAQCIQGGALQIQITNGIGNLINITKINTTSSLGQKVNLNISVVLPPSQSQMVFIPGACTTSQGSSYSNQVSFTYKEPGQALAGPYFSEGAISGAAVQVQPRSVASFNPNLNSYVLVHSSSSLNVTGSMTIVVWYYLIGALGSYNEGLVYKSETLFPGGTGPTGGYNLVLGWSTSYDFEDGPQNSSGWTTGSSGAETGSWIQLVGVKNGATNTLQLYFDGAANGPNNAATWPLTTSSANLVIGASPYLQEIFNGSISNVQIYNTALSSTQISQLYSEGLGGGPLSKAGLVAWWPLNGNANDYSGNNNNGAAINVSWVSP